MQFRFQPEAEIDLAEARLWYSLQREGLDAALMRRVDQTLAAIAAHSQSYPIVYRNLRRAVVSQFPFAIFYESAQSAIVVFAVYHSRRDPDRTLSRPLRRRLDPRGTYCETVAIT
jgi:plasmid stabilization system protein ParE